MNEDGVEIIEVGGWVVAEIIGIFIVKYVEIYDRIAMLFDIVDEFEVIEVVLFEACVLFLDWIVSLFDKFLVLFVWNVVIIWGSDCFSICENVWESVSFEMVNMGREVDVVVMIVVVFVLLEDEVMSFFKII